MQTLQQQQSDAYWNNRLPRSMKKVAAMRAVQAEIEHRIAAGRAEIEDMDREARQQDHLKAIKHACKVSFDAKEVVFQTKRALEEEKREFIHRIDREATSRADTIINMVVNLSHGVSKYDMASVRRPKEIVRARQIAMYLICKYTNLSLPQIGRKFGGRDHSTVLHGRDKVMANRAEYSDIIDPIETALGVK